MGETGTYYAVCVGGPADGKWAVSKTPVYKVVQSKICVAELFRKGIPDESTMDADVVAYDWVAVPGGAIWRLRDDTLADAFKKLLSGYQPVRVQ